MFDWTAIVTANREALLRLLTVIVGMVGERAVLPRSVHSAALSLLLPAEAAARRLVAVLAADLSVAVRAKRAAPVGAIPAGHCASERVPPFRLFDPRKRIGPRAVHAKNAQIRSFDERYAPALPAPSPGAPVSSERVRRRMGALGRALDDMPRQALRLARILARGHRYRRVMRPGNPPGHRTLPQTSRRRREIDGILADCHAAALWKLHLTEPPGAV